MPRSPNGLASNRPQISTASQLRSSEPAIRRLRSHDRQTSGILSIIRQSRRPSRSARRPRRRRRSSRCAPFVQAAAPNQSTTPGSRPTDAWSPTSISATMVLAGSTSRRATATTASASAAPSAPPRRAGRPIPRSWRSSLAEPERPERLERLGVPRLRRRHAASPELSQPRRREGRDLVPRRAIGLSYSHGTSLVIVDNRLGVRPPTSHRPCRGDTLRASAVSPDGRDVALLARARRCVAPRRRTRPHAAHRRGSRRCPTISSGWAESGRLAYYRLRPDGGWRTWRGATSRAFERGRGRHGVERSPRRDRRRSTVRSQASCGVLELVERPSRKQRVDERQRRGESARARLRSRACPRADEATRAGDMRGCRRAPLAR